MASFLASPAHFRLLGFTLASDEPTQSHRHIDRGIITVNPDPRLSIALNRDSVFTDEPILDKLNTINRFTSLLPSQTTSSKSIWGSTPLFVPYPELPPESQFKEFDEKLSVSIYQFFALHHQRIYQEARIITRTQALLASDIKRLENFACASFSKTIQNQADLRFQADRLATSISLMHQEVSKTRYHLQNTFDSLRKTRDALDLLLLRDGDLGSDMESQKYPNLHKLTYRHRFCRPRSYHPQFHPTSLAPPEQKSRTSLDLPPGKSWSISRANLRHISGHALPLRNRDSIGSLEDVMSSDQSHELIQDPNNSSSLLASAISKVHFANSKTYRYLPCETNGIVNGNSVNAALNKISNQNIQSNHSSKNDKKKHINLRTTLSLVSLRSLRKTPDAPPKLLNAKDRLHQIAAAAPKAPSNNNSQFSRWFPNMFSRGSDTVSQSQQAQSVKTLTPTPKLPELAPIDYRIVLSTSNPDTDSGNEIKKDNNLADYLPESLPQTPKVPSKYVSATSIPSKPFPNHRPRLPSFDKKDGIISNGFIASPLQNEIG